ncbi:beta-fructofuranosidase [Mycoplasmoides fastidiosum]|uniref:beta-fructofuranosidase n=1 Tax=Mycoplasmoides fastidiosum TaxID=92758 RepID=A0ABU0LYZ0_9BACT|nr:hypothetical protein [Mycoplasmoides fastidiosum]MDQ0513887.1 beta-fructofuranosidase [Mycoplasmoides fastidiosum]UUD37699.1 hypothetical protein NPA10_03975 [Mycoplasmoides fastidiosum]
MNTNKTTYIKADLWKIKQKINANNVSIYRPKTLISPNFGLIDHPAGIFFDSKHYHVIFQHNPFETNRNIKFYSMAKTHNFFTYQYQWMTNSPNSDYDEASCLGGSCFYYQNKQLIMYSGDVNTGGDILNNCVRTLVLAKLDKNAKVSQKRLLMSSINFHKIIASQFKDPFVFVHEYKVYFLVGIGTNNNRAQIWLFSFDLENNKINFLKRFEITSASWRAVECPNIIIQNDQVALVFGMVPVRTSNDTKATSRTFYTTFSLSEFFDLETKIQPISKLRQLDYGFDFYGPQIFKDKDRYLMIGQANLPEQTNFVEATDGWAGCLTPMKRVLFQNQRIYLKLLPDYIDLVRQNENEKLFFKTIEIQPGKSFYANLYDGAVLKLSIIYDAKSNTLDLERFNHPNDEQDNRRRMILGQPLTKLDFLFDVSFFDLSINNGRYVMTGRLYVNDVIQWVYLNKINKIDNFTTKIFEDL